MKKQPQRRLWDQCESLALPSDSEPQNFGLHIKRGKWIEARVKAIHYAAGSQTGAVRYELDCRGPGNGVRMALSALRGKLAPAKDLRRCPKSGPGGFQLGALSHCFSGVFFYSFQSHKTIWETVHSTKVIKDPF